VPNHAADSVIDDARIPFFGLSPLESYGQTAFFPKPAKFLDEVPVMPATVFGLDMLLQEPNIDLQAVSELVLNDVGATIHTLRMVCREYESVAERPSRMCECIAGLDAGLWFETISTRISVGGREHPATTAIWEHCRSVAQCARFVAESMDGISPDDAYLVGLLHGIGAIPAALDWSEGQLGSAMSALEEILPCFVLDAIRSASDPSSSSVWQFVLTAAHRLSAAPVNSCSPAPCDLRSMAISSVE
jgi:hypothetical protein